MKSFRLILAALLALLPTLAGAATQKPLVYSGGRYQQVQTGDVLALPPTILTQANPAQGGGVISIGPDSLGTLTNMREVHTLTGSRSAPQVGHTIEISDGATGPASSAGVNTATSASYGLSIVGMRPSWNTSTITGEMDGATIFLRQANGDTAAVLGNVGVRSGFGAFAESYTFSADSSGNAVKAVNTQIGVVNPRDGGEYGMIVQAATGTGLTAAFRAANLGSATWTDFFQGVNSSGTVLAEIRGADGAFIGGSVAPRVNLGADIGGSSTVYANAYVRFPHLDPVNFASLPTCNSAAAGTIAYITDASAAVTAWHQSITAGGGSNKTFVQCMGSGWVAF